MRLLDVLAQGQTAQHLNELVSAATDDLFVSHLIPGMVRLEVHPCQVNTLHTFDLHRLSSSGPIVVTPVVAEVLNTSDMTVFDDEEWVPLNDTGRAIQSYWRFFMEHGFGQGEAPESESDQTA